jgi:tetratricopeptide (TPR) repeat protein
MPGKKDVFQKALDEGHNAAWDQHWEQAAGYYKKALEEFPDNLNALTSLGLALYELNDNQQALTYYYKATKISPKDPMPYEKIAQLLERLGKKQESIQALTKAGDLHLAKKDVEKSIECWNQVLRLNPQNAVARIRLAVIQERRGKRPEAVEEYLELAAIMQRMGNISRATQIAQYCLKLQPENQDAKYVLSMLRANQPLRSAFQTVGVSSMGSVEETPVAEKAVELIEKLDPLQEAQEKALLQLASYMFEQAETESLEDEFERLDFTDNTRGNGTLIHENNSRTLQYLHLSQAIDAQTMGNINLASQELQTATEMGLDQPGAYYLLGMDLTESDDNLALTYLQKSSLHPDFSMAANLLMARVFSNRQDYTQAAVAYLRALSIADSQSVPSEFATEVQQLYEPIINKQSTSEDRDASFRICENIAGQLLRPDWKQQLQVTRRQMSSPHQDLPVLPVAEFLLETDSNQLVEALEQIREQTSRKNFDTAMELAFFALDYAPTYLPLHTLIGEILLERGRHEDAMHKLTLVARLYHLRGETSQGIRLLKNVLPKVPGNVEAYLLLIQLLVSQGEKELAFQHYYELADIYYQRADLENTRNTYKDAFVLAKKVKASVRVQTDFLYKQAEIDLQQLDFQQAIDVYKQICNLLPNDLNPKTRLIDLYMRAGKYQIAQSELVNFVQQMVNENNREQAFQFVNGLIEILPDWLELRKQLANLHLKSGNPVQAVEQLDLIADSLLKDGNTKGAIKLLEAIIKLNPPNVDDYRYALQQLTSQ